MLGSSIVFLLVQMYHICQFKDILRKFTCLVPTYSLGAGFRGGTIKVIVLYTYMICEGVYIIQVVVVLYILTWFGGWSCQWGDPWSADG